MGSPRNPQRTGVKPQNHLQVALAASRESLGKKRVQMRYGKRSRGFKYSGHRTCSVKGPDLSGGAPDWTCQVLARLVH
jgi:hypothetical protein